MKKYHSVLAKIRWCEDQVVIAYRYLETDSGGHFRVFRPLFDAKVDVNGKTAPPHKGWVKSTFVPRRKRALARLQKRLVRIESAEHERRSNHRRQTKREAPHV